jgi:Cytochrome P450
VLEASAGHRLGVDLRINCGMPPQTAQFSTHRNPKYWEDSEAFVPERFLDGKAAGSPAFSPFGDVRSRHLRNTTHHVLCIRLCNQRAVCCAEPPTRASASHILSLLVHRILLCHIH